MQFSVPTVNCHHCQVAIQREVSKVTGVRAVDVDLENKTVTITGEDLEVDQLLAAIDEAGYDAKPID